MKGTAVLLGLAMAAPLAGCKKPAPVSCMAHVQVGSAPAHQQCYEYVGKLAIQTARDTCGQLKAGSEVTESFSATPCPVENLIASCRIEADTDSEYLERCYAPDTLKQCEDRCSNYGGARFEKR